MADSGLLGKLLGALKGFLNSMSSPLGGYDLDDAKMSAKDGQYSVLYQFGTDHAVKDENGEDISTIQGNKIQLNVLLATANVKDAIAPLLSGLNAMDKTLLDTPEARRKASDLLAVFLGSGRESGVDEEDEHQEVGDSVKLPNDVSSIFAVSDNSSAGAKGGLLGVDLTKTNGIPTDGYTYDGVKWSWDTIMGDLIKYSLECELVGGKYGAIENVTLNDCAKLIPEYLLRMNAISNIDEVNIDVVNLVKPIAIRLQADLKQYYDAAYEKFDTMKNVKDTSKEDQEADAKAEADKAQAEKDKMVEIFEPTEDGYKSTGKTFDKTTSEGVAQIKEFAAHGYVGEGGVSLMDLVASKRITTTLRKIQGSTDFELLGLKSNYAPSETLEDLDDIIIQPEFFDALTEEPQTFDIGVDDDGYDIAVVDTPMEVAPCESIGNLLKTGIKIYRNLYVLHWMAKGNDMMKLHTLSEELYGELIQEIDTLGELMVEMQGTVISPSFGCDYLEIKSYEFQEGLDIIVNYIQEYLDCIDYAYPNQSSDVQSILDDWMRYWKKQMKYFIERQEV